MDVGSWIRQARIGADLTQAQLGERVGCTKGNVWAWEHSHHRPTPAQLKLIAQATGRPYSEVRALLGLQPNGDVQPTLLPGAADASYGSRGLAQVPVIGRTMGGVPDRVWDDEGRPTGVTDEFALLATVDPHAFLVRVAGDSMSPKYEPGDYALVEPGADIDLEDDVLVRIVGGETLLKRLLSRRGGVRLGSHRPGEPVLTFRPDELVWMYYVAHPVPAKRIKSRL